ncbi:hypothetical protein AQUSIP_21990 [Aquicella siphonis]|uniref:Uncharacterized protein n=1 Tax=Aquicella siphonis TaxID=254247 RepID=A0A5E4PKU6_9COXI|nr:CBU_0585 family protein [Aquicella siphonis]VVC76872.1 hypothetical protein AQUSIP_21990 [Aquicella siphonis]
MINIREFLGLGYYVSELDNFLVEFDKNHTKLSASQRKEIDKYNRIYVLRDTPHKPETQKTLWDQF